MQKLRSVILTLILCGVLIGNLSVAQAQDDEKLMAEWHFDEGEGNILKDSSGNGNDGVIYGATWVDGKYGKALSFDGVDDKVKISNSVISGQTEVTSEFWIKTTDNVAGIVTGANSAKDNEYLIYWGNENEIKMHLKGKYYTIPVNTITNDEWHHIAIVRAVSEVVVYIDGKFEGAWTNAPAGTFTIDPNGLWLGGDQDSVGGGWEADQQLNGIIDELCIYDRALTAEEIKTHYEQGPIALSLTKTCTPQSIKQGQTTTVTLTVKNSGSTDIRDIEIADTIPESLIFIDGETSKSYDSLSPKDSRQFQYVIQIDEAGTFNLEPVTASYADDEGNYKTVQSEPASVEVIPSLISDSSQKSPTNSNTNIQSASVNLHGEKTDVVLGEEVLLKLSAVNILGNPVMHVQVIIIPPSGWSVTSSEFAKSGAGQYTTTYKLESGGGKDIEVRILPNQIGDDFQVGGRIIYYFGDDVSTREDHTLNLPITVRDNPEPLPTSNTTNDYVENDAQENNGNKSPGFGLFAALMGLGVVFSLRRRK